MSQSVLTDKDEFPTEEVIFSHIGKSKALWQTVFEHLRANHPDLNEEWRYYKDGKSWLMKVTRKSKTIFWLSIIKDAFRTTFYFTDRAEEAITKSPISDELKQQFLNGKRYNKIRGLTITFRDEKDVEYFKSVVPLKLTIK